MSRDDNEPRQVDPPWSQEAEQSVLGSLLQDNDALANVAGMIEASSFWLMVHRRIFETTCELILANKPADVITVFEALRDRGHADECGGLAYLNSLEQSVPSARRIRDYAAIVADKAQRRALLAAVDSAHGVVRDAQSADVARDRVLSLLHGVKRVNAGKDPQPIRDLMRTRVDHWSALASGDTLPGTPTGLSGIDVALGGGIKPGRVIVLAARPTVGKTSLALQILLSVAGQGHPVVMFSQEMTAGELMDRTAANLGAIAMDRINTGKLENDDWTQVTDVAERCASLPVYVDDQPALSLLDIRAKARQVQRAAGGLTLIVVDYLQLCAAAGTQEKRHHQIEQLSRGIKSLAKELDTCVLLLSQLNRSGEGGEPEMHQLKESGAIEEDADVVLLLHPMGNEPDGSVLMLAKVAKNRGGRRGRVALSFHGKTQRWAPSNANVSRRRGAEGN